MELTIFLLNILFLKSCVWICTRPNLTNAPIHSCYLGLGTYLNTTLQRLYIQPENCEFQFPTYVVIWKYIFKHISDKTIYSNKKFWFCVFIFSLKTGLICGFYRDGFEYVHIEIHLYKNHIFKPIFLKCTYWNTCYKLLHI